MKTLFVFFIFLISFQITSAQETNPNYDEALATKLGADDYGMKSYIFVILKTGSNTTTDKEFISESFAGHMSNMNTMAEAGKLVVAGPFGQNDDSYRGLFILNVKSKEEARELLQTDPAIKANLLKAELYDWYGSAALSEYLEASDKVWKKGM
ncbi:YciI family protein [Winogradskyella sp. A3E31]|uniref:YciI family protein n=1 Tax=Winogradskyella sp. A3E31 TaxID=3349637 RepID=UPI00398AA8B6